MKAMLIAIFRAMQRKRLGTPEVRTSNNSFRTNNVVQFDRRQQSPTGRKLPTPQMQVVPGPRSGRISANAPVDTNLTDVEAWIIHSQAIAQRGNMEAYYAQQEAKFDDGYEWARRSCESAWPQPTANHAPNFHDKED